MQKKANDWSVLFLKSSSPGQVFRFLERRMLSGEIYPPLLLSDNATAENRRALFPVTASAANQERLRAIALPLAVAFTCRVTLLYQTTSPEPQWGYMIFTEQGEVENGTEPLLSKRPRWIDRLPGARPVEPPPLQWARKQGLPVERVPFLIRTRPAVPVVDYGTVAGLDQRRLLVENAPRLYRFEMPNG
jgi:hypothetical protein